MLHAFVRWYIIKGRILVTQMILGIYIRQTLKQSNKYAKKTKLFIVIHKFDNQWPILLHSLPHDDTENMLSFTYFLHHHEVWKVINYGP